MQNTLIVITGPTGTGKSDIAIELALNLKTEIISCDSRQFYREMKIGTAVPSEQQLEMVRHHFIGHLSVTSSYSSSHFEKDVLSLLPSLFSRSAPVIMAGGSGLYINAVCRGIDTIPDVDEDIRKFYINKYETEGIESLRAELSLVDPVHYRKVDLRNYKRILRALEITASTGRPYSSFMKRDFSKRDFNIITIGLERDRDELYTRINSRVDNMITGGLEEEARGLIKYRHLNALNTVGYRELFEYFDGNISRERAIELIKRNSRHYARRQITWFNRYKEIKWFHPGDTGSIISYIRENIRQET